MKNPTKIMNRYAAAIAILWLGCVPYLGAEPVADLRKAFVEPPASARPWVYWFWLNGNITSNGITADLEAMKRVGVGGVLIMEVDQGTPVGPMDFMGKPWRSLFSHVVAEAGRLGLEVNMNDDAGWNGSGGPWIKPEQSMQKVVWSETNVTGPQQFSGVLPQPRAVAGFYRDITVLAFPAVGGYRIDNIASKAAFQVGGVDWTAPTNLPPEMVIDRSRLTELKARMSADGRLTWDVPAGNWTVMRIGHTSTGAENAPAPASGRGLECDKLSQEGIAANFAGMMGPLIGDVGRAAGKTLVTTHIDSWENGSQNWTARMQQEFQTRRGYDLLPFLPVLSGRVVGDLQTSDRFLWDLRQTVSDLVVENYAGHMQQLARQHGLKLSIEAYGGPCDDLPYAGRADEPMCEFWIGGGAFSTIKEMASAAHTYGKRILGAESFTAADQEKWLQHPGSIKSLGDRAFCDGVSRFVFHRYAMQPWQDYQPGMTMGPWGLHYERTETWWEKSRPWHEYLARCQFLLRQGLFVADLCYLQPEQSPQSFYDHPRNAYDFDNCSAEVVMTRMSVKDGRIVLPDGISYRLLVLPNVTAMTPQLLAKIKQLVQAGATVVGPRPVRSPSLKDYPQCDAQVKQLGEDLWGNCDGRTVLEHVYGKGRVIWGTAPDKVLAQAGVRPDFTNRERLGYIHRQIGESDLYFVANPHPREVQATCRFRVSGKQPEFWWPETGRIEAAAMFDEADGCTRVVLPLGPSESVFVVFRKGASAKTPLIALNRDGQPLFSTANLTPKITVKKALYGILDDPQRTRDVRAQVQRMVDAGTTRFPVSDLVKAGDPAPDKPKTLVVEYVAGNAELKVTGKDGDTVQLPETGAGIIIQKATYGVPGDAKRTRDVRAKLQHLVDAGEYEFMVARMAEGDDPAFGIVKTLVVEYTLDGRPATATGTDPDAILLVQPTASERIAQARVGSNGKPQVEIWKPGDYELKSADGKSQPIDAKALPAPIDLSGFWEVRFAPGRGAPESATFERLMSLSQHADPGIKYFSGEATYTKTFQAPKSGRAKGQRTYLDLGRVEVLAEVKLNGKNLGILWRPPYRVDITESLKRGENTLEVKVVNLWPNRMIGDEQLPEDSQRNPDGTLKAWPQWVKEGKPSPTGRFTFTSWRLWKKDSPLVESGLIGPVSLRVSERFSVK